MGGKGALNYLPIVPKASIYVPKVMHKPVMGGNTVSERVEVPNPTKRQPIFSASCDDCVKGRERPSISSIYAQRLLMVPNTMLA